LTTAANGPIKIVIDTDIADDIDDAMALAFALGSPEFEILGVTVVYGDVTTRAKVTRKLLDCWGRDDVPVRVGYERPMGYDWQPTAAPQECSQRDAVADDPPLADPSRTAPAFIADCVRRHPHQVHLLTLGALTNVAAALCAEPDLAGVIPGIASAALGRHPCPPEGWGPGWNVRYDPVAAQCIARSGVPWTTACGCGDNSMTQPQFQALGASGRPADDLLLDLVVLMNRHKFGFNPAVRSIEDVRAASVGDVAVLASFLVPERFAFVRGRVEVASDGHNRFTPDADGPHRVPSANLPAGEYRDEILQRLMGRLL